MYLFFIIGWTKSGKYDWANGKKVVLYYSYIYTSTLTETLIAYPTAMIWLTRTITGLFVRPECNCLSSSPDGDLRKAVLHWEIEDHNN